MDKANFYLYINLEGDTIARLKSTILLNTVGRFAVFKHEAGYAIYDILDAKKLTTFDDKYELNYETGSMGYIYVKSQRMLFFNNKYKQVEYADVASFSNSLLMVKYAGSIGLIDSAFTEVLPCKYKSLTHIQDNYFNVSTAANSAIWNSQNRKIIFQFKHVGRFAISKGTVIAAYPNNQAWYYSINDDFKKTDSLRLKNYVMIQPSNQRFWNGNNWSNNVQRELKPIWFSENRENGRFYGLLSSTGDTLIRAMLTRVIELNDSICKVGIKRFEHKVFSFKGYAKIVSTFHYGFINQNTGKWVVVPQYPYIDDKEFMDSTLDVFRVITKTNDFYLINKLDFKKLETTKATFISAPEKGYFRLFKNAKYLLEKEKDALRNQPHFLLSKFSELLYFGRVNYTRNTGGKGVFITPNKVNIANSQGSLILDDSLSASLCFVFAPYKNDFIVVNKENQYAVLTDKGLEKLPFKYAKIERLSEDSNSFLLQLTNLKYGIVNSNGQVLSTISFDDIKDFASNYSWAKNGDTTLLIDKNGVSYYTQLGKTRTTSVSFNRTAIKTSRYYNLLDEKGRIISNDDFTFIGTFINGFAYAKSRDKGSGIINADGEWVMSEKYTSLKKESPNYFIFNGVRRNKIYNRSGVLIGKIHKKNRIDFFEGQKVLGITSKKNMQFYDQNMKLISNKKYAVKSIYNNDTILSIKGSSIYYRSSIDRKIRKRFRYKGGITAYQKGRLYADKSKTDRDFHIRNLSAYAFLYPSLFNAGESRVLYAPKGINFGFKLINKDVPACMVNNALIYAIGGGVNVMYGLFDTLGNQISNQYFKSLQYIGGHQYIASYTDDANVTYQGVMNNLGVWVIEPKFNEIRRPSNGLFVVASRTNYQIADSSGNMVSKKVFTSVKLEQGYYLLKSSSSLSWWHPSKGWLFKAD